MPFTDSPAARRLRKRLQAQYKEQNRPCAICGQPIDYQAPRTTYHPNSLDLDHIQPTKTHPHLELVEDNIQPVHASCNRHKSDGVAIHPIGNTSRIW